MGILRPREVKELAWGRWLYQFEMVLHSGGDQVLSILFQVQASISEVISWSKMAVLVPTIRKDEKGWWRACPGEHITSAYIPIV